jgi:DNA (cytosine-5)-methyltransferase 1
MIRDGSTAVTVSTPRLTIGSTFSGIGGLDLAFENTGHFTTQWFSEVDTNASAVLKHHWPDVPNYGDIRDLDPRKLRPSPDLILSGFPCPDFSVSGGRSGLDGERGRLWWETHRLVAGLRPTWFVAENVPGLQSSNEGRDFRAVVDSLVDLGYGVVWRMANSRWWGVPQNRRRLIIVGHLGSRPRPEVLAIGESLPGDYEPGGEARRSHTAGSVRSSNSTGDVVGTVMPTFGSRYYSNLQEVQAGSLLAFTANQRDEVCRLDVAGALHAYPGPTQQTYIRPQGRYVRRLTPLEMERLQGFPDGWTSIEQPESHRVRQLGNAVTVPVFQWVADRLHHAHRTDLEVGT